MADAYETASRLVELLDQLDRGRPLRLGEICERYGVKDACARRYIDWLKKHRAVLEEREGKQKVWRKSPEQAMSPGTLARAAALAFAVEALAELDGTDQLEELRAMADVARLGVPDGQRPKLARVVRTFEVRNPSRSLNRHRTTQLRDLVGAIQERRVCSMRYRRQNADVREYRIEPWGLVLYGGRLLLVAGKQGAPALERRRFFEVDGIIELEVDKERFQEPADHHVNYDDVLQDSLGIYCDWGEPAQQVHLRVAGRHAVQLSHRAVHPSQQQIPAEDGWLDVYLRVVLSPDLITFVLGMMPDVVVVAPTDLATRVQEAASRFLVLQRSAGDR